MLILLILAAGCLKVIDAHLDASMFTAFFLYKNVRFGTVFTCTNIQERINILKHFTATVPIPISIIQISANITDDAFKNHNRQTGYILDGDCHDLDFIFRKCNYLKLFHYQHHWLVAVTSRNATIFSNLWLNINSDVWVASHDGDVFDVYKASAQHNTPLNVTKLGKYGASEGFTINNRNIHLYERRRDFYGTKFHTMIVLPAKFEGTLENHVRWNDHPEINSFNRINGRLNYYSAEYYNFTVELEVTKSWGYKLSNGSFDGLVASLGRGTSDFGGSPLFMLVDRFEFVDYGIRAWSLGSSFFFRNPRQNSSFEVFLRPLDTLVWLVIIISSVVIVLTMRFVLTVEHKLLPPSEIVAEPMDSSWSNLILFISSSLCQQDSPQIPHFLSGRIVAVFVFVMSLLLYQFYSGSVVSFLLMDPPMLIKTVRQLARSDLKIGSEDVRFTSEYLKLLFSQDVEMRHLGEKLYPGKEFYQIPEVGLQWVALGGYAFHLEESTAYPIIERTFQENALCDLVQIPLFKAKPVVQNFRKGSPFRKMLNFMVHKMIERGVHHRLRMIYQAKKPECIRLHAPTYAVGLNEFYPALVIMAIGLGLSLLILLAEIVSVSILHKKDVVKPFIN